MQPRATSTTDPREDGHGSGLPLDPGHRIPSVHSARPHVHAGLGRSRHGDRTHGWYERTHAIPVDPDAWPRTAPVRTTRPVNTDGTCSGRRPRHEASEDPRVARERRDRVHVRGLSYRRLVVTETSTRVGTGSSPAERRGASRRRRPTRTCTFPRKFGPATTPPRLRLRSSGDRRGRVDRVRLVVVGCGRAAGIGRVERKPFAVVVASVRARGDRGRRRRASSARRRRGGGGDPTSIARSRRGVAGGAFQTFSASDADVQSGDRSGSRRRRRRRRLSPFAHCDGPPHSGRKVPSRNATDATSSGVAVGTSRSGSRPSRRSRTQDDITSTACCHEETVSFEGQPPSELSHSDTNHGAAGPLTRCNRG
jgi:hypothetical protein